MYHEIGRRDRYSVDLPDFAAQVRWLHDRGFRTVLPQEAEHAAAAQGRHVMITFDDGHASDCRSALPVLARYGFTAVSFVTTGFIGRERYMTWDEVRELQRNGFSIQSHTHTHRLLNTIGPDGIRQELAVSREIIEDRLGLRPDALALPGGGWPAEAAVIAQEQGYRRLFTSKPWKNGLREASCRVYNRTLVHRGTTMDAFARIVEQDTLACAASTAGYLVREKVKSVIGPQRYHRFWKKFVKGAAGEPGPKGR
jgi:peptidoglycan/xylan/chitin deacetylase (PgdA/CDA1 family)